MKVFSIVLMSAVLSATAIAQQDAAKVIAETWVSGDKVVKGQPFSAEAVSEFIRENCKEVGFRFHVSGDIIDLSLIHI